MVDLFHSIGMVLVANIVVFYSIMLLVSFASVSSASNVLSTSFTKMMGVQYPILNAAMGNTATCSMAMAVSQAGGFGVIGFGYAVNETRVQEWLQQCNAAKGPDGKKLRFAAGFITFHLDFVPKSFDHAISAKPVAIHFSFGNASKYAARAHAAGIKVISQIQTVDAAVMAAQYSDVIVAQGQEAGGHGSSGISTWPLFTQVLQKFKDLKKNIPVIAAGGLGDENGLLRALYLGGSGILMGTRFLATPESGYPDNYKYQVLAAKGSDTVRSDLFDLLEPYADPFPPQYNVRALNDSFIKPYLAEQQFLLRNATALKIAGAAYVKAGGFPVYAGKAVNYVKTVENTKDIVQKIVKAAIAVRSAR